jgi:DNA ligase-1
MTIKKPQLAEDAILDKVQFPCWVQPKIDGVRAMNLNGTLTGRSLDPFEGWGITQYWSRPEFQHLDGEMILGDDPKADGLCRLTTGAMGKFKGISEMADLNWWVFDYLPDPDMPYSSRYTVLNAKLEYLASLGLSDRIHLVPYVMADNIYQLQSAIAANANAGFEGTIIRNPRAAFKPGRATLKGQELWRIKPWADAEILVTGITEGNVNTNEAKKNTLGRTERSSAAAGLIPNGQVGSIQGTMVADFYDPYTGKLLFKKGLEVTVGSGEMSVNEARFYFARPYEIVGHLVKFKHMTHGTKDQPRFPTYISHRLKEDMS